MVRDESPYLVLMYKGEALNVGVCELVSPSEIDPFGWRLCRRVVEVMDLPKINVLFALESLGELCDR
jgi:hypothetical protein